MDVLADFKIEGDKGQNLNLTPKLGEDLRVEYVENESSTEEEPANDDLIRKLSSRNKPCVHKVEHSQKPFITFGHDNWDIVLHMIFGVNRSVLEGANQ